MAHKRRETEAKNQPFSGQLVLKSEIGSHSARNSVFPKKRFCRPAEAITEGAKGWKVSKLLKDVEAASRASFVMFCDNGISLSISQKDWNSFSSCSIAETSQVARKIFIVEKRKSGDVECVTFLRHFWVHFWRKNGTGEVFYEIYSIESLRFRKSRSSAAAKSGAKSAI